MIVIVALANMLHRDATEHGKRRCGAATDLGA
jgi:hypothetical protein